LYEGRCKKDLSSRTRGRADELRFHTSAGRTHALRGSENLSAAAPSGNHTMCLEFSGPFLESLNRKCQSFCCERSRKLQMHRITWLAQNSGQRLGTNRDFQPNCWANVRILGQPCGSQVPRPAPSSSSRRTDGTSPPSRGRPTARRRTRCAPRVDYVRLPLRRTAQPVQTRFPITFRSRFF
jgi:hypothetical protein